MFFIYFPSNSESTSGPSSPSVRVHVVAYDGGLDELGGCIRCWLAPGTYEASIFKVWAVEGLHFIDLVGQVHVTIDS